MSPPFFLAKMLKKQYPIIIFYKSIMKKSKWRVLNKRIIFNVPYHRIDQWKVKIPNGKVYSYNFNMGRDFVIIFALTKDNNVVLNDQYNLFFDKRALEIPAGFIDGGTALTAAKHELLEETGYKAKKWVKLGRASTGRWNSNFVSYYLALDAYCVGKQALEPSEDIKVKLMPIKNYIKLLRAGKIEYNTVTSCSYLALDKLGKL